MSVELLPCPFCGGQPVSYAGRACSSVKCDNWHAVHVYGATLEHAIAAWNTRTPADALLTERVKGEDR